MPVALRRITEVLRDLRPQPRGEGLVLPDEAALGSRRGAAIGLVAGALLALLWVNAGFGDAYTALRDAQFVAGIASHPVSVSLRALVNDALMTAFFLTIGLSAKRHVARRRLADAVAVAPAAAALASAVPAFVLLSLAASRFVGDRAWLLAVGPDIGFALVALTLVRHRAPEPVADFTLTFMIAADALAVLALFLFGAFRVSWPAFVLAVVFYSAYGGAARLRALRGTAMGVTGALFWAAWYAAGFPPAIAGAFLALFVPLRPQGDERAVAEESESLLDRYDTASDAGQADRCSGLAARMVAVARQAEPPADRWQRRLAPWLTFVILPLFGWVNAGVFLTMGETALVVGAGLSLLLALLLGKPLGFLTWSWALSRRRRGGPLEDIPMRDLLGLSLFSASGGVIAVYAATRVVPEGAARDAAVVAIVLVSVATSLAGAIVSRRVLSND